MDQVLFHKFLFKYGEHINGLENADTSSYQVKL